MEPLKVALTFVEAINSGRAGELAALMTADHVFVDSDGTEVSGRERMREGWESYFAMVPDFRIEVERTFAEGDTVVLLGRSSGTFAHEGRLDPANGWSAPAAWRAVVAGDRVARWQVYVNPQAMVEILDRSKSV